MEATGAISPASLKVIGYHARRARGKHARDGTKYGSRASATNFYSHHAQRISMAAAIGGAAGIHKAVRIMSRPAALGAGRPLRRRLNGQHLAFGVCAGRGARRWFCGFGSGGAFACCASVLSVVVKNFICIKRTMNTLYCEHTPGTPHHHYCICIATIENCSLRRATHLISVVLALTIPWTATSPSRSRLPLPVVAPATSMAQDACSSCCIAAAAAVLLLFNNAVMLNQLEVHDEAELDEYQFEFAAEWSFIAHR